MKRTLEEAIKYYSELAEENEKDAEQFKRIKATQDMISHCYECAEEHRQLAEWLTELKDIKNLVSVTDKKIEQNTKDGLIYFIDLKDILLCEHKQLKEMFKEVKADES